MSKQAITSFGECIRGLRESSGLPIRKIADQLDIDPSLLGKIERNERHPSKEFILKIAKIFSQNEKDLTSQFLSDQFAYKILEEEADLRIFKVAEEKVRYLRKLNKK